MDCPKFSTIIICNYFMRNEIIFFFWVRRSSSELVKTYFENEQSSVQSLLILTSFKSLITAMFSLLRDVMPATSKSSSLRVHHSPNNGNGWSPIGSLSFNNCQSSDIEEESSKITEQIHQLSTWVFSNVQRERPHLIYRRRFKS